ncbi:conserved hypothetical protein [Histoplasma capsulatum var. duboisii H88]|uniref:Mso1 N-terminal domain-containing protein n=1 Tax=Ajellomyces capsulatus (strain H88) TaxID=544711 RepID=F0UV83_AJEC8|nr:conserved hypothetical protein [Histoplasma capsulatum var. duboisii H88]QSS50976.1 hypothetical protein I7I53_06183 [Histoplasma capsulatum var. duboisii H88]
MASYFSSLKSSSAISNFSTRFNSLRRAISSGDETDDPDSEDCSHISNVLRAYYTEKGRRFPAWLPPDPKSPAPPPPTVAVATQASFQGYGGAPPPGGAAGGGLGDLWGDPSPARHPPQQQQTSSLRLGRNASHQPQPTSSSHLMPSPPNGPPRPATSAPTPRTTGLYFDGQNSRTPPPPTTTSARPLPSQLAGSYQTSQAAQQQQQNRLGSELEKSTSAVSAQERLRARLHGSSANSSPSRTPSPGYSRNEQSGGGGQTHGSSRPWERAGQPRGPR